MSNEPPRQPVRFRFGLANLFRATTWVAVGLGSCAAIWRFIGAEQSASTKVIAAVASLGIVIMSFEAACGALVGRTASGFLVGFFLFVFVVASVPVIAFVMSWFP